MTRDRQRIRTQLTSYTLSTAQTGFTARPWVHALRVKAYDWGQQHTLVDVHRKYDV